MSKVRIFRLNIKLFRGEFVGLNGPAAFYVAEIKSLYREAETSLQLFLGTCQEEGIAGTHKTLEVR